MIKKSIQILTLATTLVVSASGYATAQMSDASATISMRAVVPLVCRVAFSADGPADALGVANQFCNNPDGYTLHALATGDVSGASLIVDGRKIALIPGQEVLIDNVSGPTRKATPIGYEPGEDSDGGNLTLRIQAN